MSAAAARAAALSSDVRSRTAALESEVAAYRARHGDIVGSHLRRRLAWIGAVAVHAVRHPFDLVAWLAMLVWERPAIADLRRGVNRYLIREVPIRESEQVGTWVGAGGDVRWLPAVRLRTLEHDTLFSHPESAATFGATATAPGRFVVWCGLLPASWTKNPGGVSFEVTVTADRDVTTGGQRVLRPRRCWRHRRWVPLSVPVRAGELEIRLSTRLPPGAPPDYAWAIWGAPALAWRRPVADVLRSARAGVRTFGVRGAWARLRDVQTRAGEAGTYRAWLARHERTPDDLASLADESQTWAFRPRMSVITPVWNTDPACLRACIESVRNQTYRDWELCLADDASDRSETLAVLQAYAADARIRLTRLPVNSHICAASNAALALATGEFVVMLDHDDTLAPDALAEIVRLLQVHPDADFIYSDEDKLDLSGRRCDPCFKPDWSPELFESYMYTCHLMALRRTLVEQVGGFRRGLEGAQDFDLALRVSEQTSRVHHIPRVLYHWRKLPESTASSGQAKPWALRAARQALVDHLQRTGADAEVADGAAPGLFRVRHRLRGAPLVSIVIPTDGRVRDVHGEPVDLVTNAVRSIVQKTTYRHFELVIVDNGRLSAATQAFLSTVPHRRVSYSITGSFNFAHKLNFSVRHATGSQLVIFNDDLEVIASEWLTAMLEFAQQPAIGAVGARLLYPDGRLQHVGMTLGVCGIAAHDFHMSAGAHPGYASSALVIRNCSAVTGACMMTRRDVFDEVGGFNERLAIDFNDVDYCLKLRARGYRIVYTPYARLYHHEAGTLGPRAQSPREAEEMRQMWGDALERDPYYNPNLTTEYPDYRLGS